MRLGPNGTSELPGWTVIFGLDARVCRVNIRNKGSRGAGARERSRGPARRAGEVYYGCNYVRCVSRRGMIFDSTLRVGS